jgi:3-hydroxyacyl-[acyl-carrier-protein] dehydratase
MRYLLIDRIDYLKVNDSIRAVKCVALSEDIFSEHFFGYPVFPGALLIEAIAQAGTALLEYSNNYKKKALLVMVDQTKFRSLIRPGDQLLISAEIISAGIATAKLNGEIRLGSRMVMNGIFTFALQDAIQFYPDKTRHLMETIYDIWLENTEIVKSGSQDE